MKEQVTDIMNYIKQVANEMSSMQHRIDEQHQEICNLTRNNQKLNHEIAKLKEENKELKERLSKYEDSTPPINSQNSSTPPSKEPLKAEIIRRTRSLREKSDRLSGGQKGHKGYTLLTSDEVDEEVVHQAKYCSECGALLGDDCETVDEYDTQEVDVVVEKVRRRHLYRSVICKCGCHNRVTATRRRGGNKVQYGKMLRSFIVYLNIVQLVPYERLQQLVNDLFGIHMSQGTIDNILKASNEKAKPLIAMLISELKKQRVVGFDETGCYCESDLDWVWIAQTIGLTLVFREEGRNADVLTKKFGESIKHMTAVTDRHSSYFKLPFLDHQVYLPHLLRNLQYLDDLNKEQTWSRDIAALFREAIHERHLHPADVFDTAPWLTRLDNLLKKSTEGLHEKFAQMQKGLIKCRDFIFRFLADPEIPSDNNASERGFRKVKLKQKISGGFRSDDGADTFLALLSVCDTTRKNNMSVFRQLQSLC